MLRGHLKQWPPISSKLAPLPLDSFATIFFFSGFATGFFSPCSMLSRMGATTGTGVLPVPVAIERVNNYAIFEQDSALGALGDIGVVGNHQDGRS